MIGPEPQHQGDGMARPPWEAGSTDRVRFSTALPTNRRPARSPPLRREGMGTLSAAGAPTGKSAQADLSLAALLAQEVWEPSTALEAQPRDPGDSRRPLGAEAAEAASTPARAGGAQAARVPAARVRAAHEPAARARVAHEPAARARVAHEPAARARVARARAARARGARAAP